MAHCPRCLCALPDRARTCGRCGLALPGTADELSAPLPAPMIEPVHTPVPSDAVFAVPPAKSVLVRALTNEGDDALVASCAAPKSGDPNLTHAPAADTLQNHVAGSTLPAHPTQPGSPMNDSVAEQAHQTVPATARADQPPAPTPAPQLQPKLVVLRGARIGVEYPIYDGRNTIGRFADKPVDIDLVSQETTEQIWCSRQHAVIIFEKGNVLIEDLNSLNGTWVNGVRIHAGQPRVLRPGDVVQVGTVQMKLVVG